MADWRYEEHLRAPVGAGALPPGAHDGIAGGAACGDLVRFGVAVDGDRVAGAGFLAEGCGALTVCASVACELVDGAHVLDAARVSVGAIADGVGGLHPGKRHAAELVADALHRALGTAVFRDGAAPDDARDGTLVAMSGGVDSAVAALLAGPGAAGVTLELWRDPENDAEGSCCSHSAVRRARDMAHAAGLPHLTLDLREEFRAGVVEPWLAGHRAGETPNPCVRCNGEVRLGAMLDLADRLGRATLTTGHYARTTDDGLLRLAADPAKDQAYMLGALPPDAVRRMRFPLGGMTKDETRRLAADAGLRVATQPDSQDLCFLAGTGRSRFLERHGAIAERPGAILDADSGLTVGEHRGAHLYTLGQRRGLGVAAPEPRYVVATDVATNTVTLGPRRAMLSDRVALRDVVLHRPAAEVDAAKLRYRQAPRAARLTADDGAGPADAARDDGTATLTLDEPLVRAAPGQTALLLAHEVVVGHATVA